MSKKIKSISISDETWQRAKLMAEKDWRSLSNYITHLINKDYATKK